jgi:hypothetical protein
VRESEGGRAALRSRSIRVQEGSQRWRAVRRRDGRAAVASVAEGRQQPGDGPAWAEVGHVSWVAAGLARKNKKNELGCYGHRAELAMGYEFFSQFSNKDLSFKIKDSNAFKPNLN